MVCKIYDKVKDERKESYEKKNVHKISYRQKMC